MRRLLCLLFFLVLALPASAAGLLDSRPSSTLGSINNSADFLPVRAAFKLSLVESTPQSIKLRFVATEGYYLYRHRFQFRAEPADIGLGAAQLPKGEQKHDEFFGDVEVYHGILDIDLPRTDSRAFTLVVTYQGCADKGLCYPPETERLSIDGSDAATTSWSWRELALFFSCRCWPDLHPLRAADAADPFRGGPARAGRWFTRFQLVAGLCAANGRLFRPARCIDGNVRRTAQSSGALAVGLGAGAVRDVFFAVFALAMFGVFELKLPHAISSRLDRIAGRTEGGSLWGAAVLGVVSSLLVSPCVSAPLAGALLYISASGDALGGGLKLFMLGLGMGAPLLLVATGGAAWLPKKWSMADLREKNAIGVLLLGLAIALLSRVLPGQITLLLIGLLAGGVGLFMGALEFVYKPPRKTPGAIARDVPAVLCPGLLVWRLQRPNRSVQPHWSTAQCRRQRSTANRRQLANHYHASRTGPRPRRSQILRNATAARLVRRLVHQLQSHRTRSSQRCQCCRTPQRLSIDPFRHHRQQRRTTRPARPLRAIRSSGADVFLAKMASNVPMCG